jgi:GT2 family glycosyltransferase
MPEKLQRQMDCFTDCPEYGLVATRCLTNTVDTRFNTIAIHRIRRSGKSGWIYKDLFYKNFVRTSSVVIQKKCFQEVGVFDEELPRCNDIDMWLRITKKYPVGFLNEPLTIYTRRPKEIRRDNIEGRKIWIQVLEKHYDPDLIPKKLYRRRMARVYGHIAENALKKGEREEVKQFLYQTLLLSPFNLKALKTYVLLHLKK